ncbi:helix-turn-helix domain-containing protein [Nonomuraea angiospora]
MGDQLGEFSRAHRAALDPDESDMPSYGRRRVPGLRRDEVAQPAGISVKYYARLEQGESHQMSDSVLHALGNALRLSVDERAHLVRLARPAQAEQIRRPYVSRSKTRFRALSWGSAARSVRRLSPSRGVAPPWRASSPSSLCWCRRSGRAGAAWPGSWSGCR